MNSQLETGTGERIRVGSDALRFRVTSAESDGALIAYDVELAPGGGPPMLHRHAAFELFRVDAGELTIYLEDTDGQLQRHPAPVGAVLAIPGGREHTVRNESAAGARAFAVVSPGDQMERFARRAAELSEHGEPDAAEALATLAARCGIEITRAVREVLR